MTSSVGYPPGYSEAEARRLAQQATLLEDLTENLFLRAGLARGMNVLDAGCGLGDVSFLAARLVGESGSVLGIDRAPSSVETARRRAEYHRVTHATFMEADLSTFRPDRTFDAVVGRLVLLYVPDAPSVLRRLSRAVRPSGIIAFQEYDMSQAAQEPESQLFKQVRRWILGTFSAAGVQVNMGTKLYATYLRAALPHPTIISAALVHCGPTASRGYEDIAGVVRSLLPLIESNGIASSAEIEIDTLADRLQEDALANERVYFMPRLVGAWARVGEAV
jgi:ubiquinone/menaquinone biosynthesis C-methylase UbiE